jgi:hypothetical protein
MRTGWVYETSPSDHYWWRYEVGQWLGFEWLWSWGSLDSWLARQKLGKKHTHQSWQPPLPYGCHGAFPPSPPHTTISQHAAWQVYVVKTREYYCFYHVFISYFEAQHIDNALCLSVCGLCGTESIILSVGGTETIILSHGGRDDSILSAIQAKWPPKLRHQRNSCQIFQNRATESRWACSKTLITNSPIRGFFYTDSFM